MSAKISVLRFAVCVICWREFFARETISRAVFIREKQARRLAKGKRTHKHGIQGPEDCSRCANAECEGEDRDDRESRVLAHIRAS